MTENTPIATVFAGNLPAGPLTLREKKRERFKASYIKNYKMLQAMHKNTMDFLEMMKMPDDVMKKVDDSMRDARAVALGNYRRDMSEYNNSIRKIKQQEQK